MWKSVIALLSGWLVLCHGPAAAAQQFTIRLKLQGRQLEGTPLDWSSSDVVLLARDGHLWSFKPHEAQDYRKTANGFRSYSQSEMRAQLAQEFGRRFEVSGTGHYLVVHPAGQRDRWAERFEQIYRRFVHYFTARGFRPDPPRFPLVAVVFPDRSEFMSHVRRTGARSMPRALGYYSVKTNRTLLYDVTAGQSESDLLWQTNAGTIIHEAAHQCAFNVGIHSRYAMPPRWVAEGLGTMFEAPGVWNSRDFTSLTDRVNRSQLAAFQQYMATSRKKGAMLRLIASDRHFVASPDAGYAEAWALTFYLAETRPRDYCDYLRKTAQRTDFSEYEAAERVRDFTKVFGSDLEMQEARFLRFIGELKTGEGS